MAAKEIDGQPTVPMPLMPSGAPSTFNIMPVFNSAIQVVDPLVNPYPTVVTPQVHSYRQE
jgi:hypothetical protein